MSGEVHRWAPRCRHHHGGSWCVLVEHEGTHEFEDRSDDACPFNDPSFWAARQDCKALYGPFESISLLEEHDDYWLFYGAPQGLRMPVLRATQEEVQG